MNAGLLSGGQECLRVPVSFEARDVLPDRAGKQFNVLRQVADVSAQRLARPLAECGSIESHATPSRLPHTDQGTGECRLAGRARANDAKCRATLQFKRDAVD